MVVSVYLHAKCKPVWATAIPLVIMLVLTAWAMTVNLRLFCIGGPKQLHLFVIGLIVAALEVWMIVEVALHITRKRPGAVPAG